MVHLESGDEVVIIEGSVAEIRLPSMRKRIDQAYRAKYKMATTDAPGDVVVYGVTPEVVLAWREKDFPKSATRWVVTK